LAAASVAMLSPTTHAALPAHAAARDRDGDGLSNRFERKRSHTNPRRKDTDKDRLSDRFEVGRSHTNPRKKDTDKDRLSDRFEVRRSHTNPRRKDTDRDTLRDRFELRRSHTNPRKKDTDGDGLTDGFEVRRSRTNPRRKDTDGDGYPDGLEVLVGSDPRNPRSIPSIPAPAPPPASASPLPPLGAPSCVASATSVTTAGQARAAAAAGQNVCVISNVGDVNLSYLSPASITYVGTQGAGQMGFVNLSSSQRIILRARFQSTELRNSNSITIESSIIGGTSSSRVMDQLIFIPEGSNDVTIRDSDIGWTAADNSGNTGYGLRVYGSANRLRVERNRFHDIAADAIQGMGNGADVVIDRNEIGPVGANPGSSEHSDNIQVIDNGPNLQITNNWIHHQGYYDGQVTANAGLTYVHGGTSNSLLIQNNLFQAARGRVEICGLGTGGTSRSNVAIRWNTFTDGGQAFTGFPGFEWDCDSGSGNVVDRNIAVDPDSGFANNGSLSGAAFSANLFGPPSLVALDGSGDCTSSNCNPPGGPIGFRKPPGVHW
jgi:hypothetical protein